MGAERFLALLQILGALPPLTQGWRVLDPTSGYYLTLWEQRAAFLEFSRAINAVSDDYYIFASAATDPRIYDVFLRWNRPEAFVDLLSLDLWFAPGGPESLEAMMRRVIAAVVAWERPQHLAIMPTAYRRDHHPFDRTRTGIGWMGWLPFALAPGDVPEAELVEPLYGGTLVASQREFWQTDDAAAVARAQDLDLRLNLIGVLPTILELRRGDWGR
ncbi:Imm52 family immunity protein [Sorangium cellulosum]|uniref:Imm52 family immunity protein n=1 Tax=Sorangium cellulosum TaxID=56 RepID=UPI001F354CA2|nr:Imm52 family immunity protein [Sorangium cellulosum]